MYASKRRQRNFKRIREPSKPGSATNPSKRHRERLNGELETVASLLPFDGPVIQRLDKLSVLRLAVSYLQIKAHFQAMQHQLYVASSYPCYPTSSQSLYPAYPSSRSLDYGMSTSAAAAMYPMPVKKNDEFEAFSLQALGGFILILNENGEVYYASENVEGFLGFHQDREDVRLQLHWNYSLPPHATAMQDLFTPEGLPYLERNLNARFRCLLDNTCGFLRIDIRGKLAALHGLPQSFVMGRAEPGTVLGLVAVCSPFVPPTSIDCPDQQHPFLKSKHGLDLTVFSIDSKTRAVLEMNDSQLPISFFALVHPDDAPCLAEAHKEGISVLSSLLTFFFNDYPKNPLLKSWEENRGCNIAVAVTKNGSSGLLVYRMISCQSQRVYWFQSSCRMFYKNGKAESIGCTHRMLTEAEGMLLLEKRASLSAKLLSFDDALLQSPKLLQATAAMLPNSSTSSVVHQQQLHHRDDRTFSSIESSNQVPELQLQSNFESTKSETISNGYQPIAYFPPPPPLLPPKKRKSKQPHHSVDNGSAGGDAATPAGDVYPGNRSQYQHLLSSHQQHALLFNPHEFNNVYGNGLSLQLAIPQDELSAFASFPYEIRNGCDATNYYGNQVSSIPTDLYYQQAYPSVQTNSTCHLFYSQPPTIGVPASLEHHHHPIFDEAAGSQAIAPGYENNHPRLSTGGNDAECPAAIVAAPLRHNHHRQSTSRAVDSSEGNAPNDISEEKCRRKDTQGAPMGTDHLPALAVEYPSAIAGVTIPHCSVPTSTAGFSFISDVTNALLGQ